MSELTVAKITTPSNTTPLTFTTGNSSGGFIKVETANDQILFSGTPRFTGEIPGITPTFSQANTARDHANVSFGQANTARTHANASFDQANTARTHANASFDQANTARTHANASFGQANTATTNAGNAFGQANTARNLANTALQNTTGTFAGTLTTTGSINDSIGNIRDLPINNKTSAYVVVATDLGKTISITTGGVTVPNAIFSAGDVFSIFNNSGTSQTITQGGSITMYLAGSASTGNRTLGQRGLSTVLCVAANTFVISGAGIS